MEIMDVLVATKNPAKLSGVRAAVEKFFGHAEVTGIDTPSGVRDTPTSLEETVEGAENRLNQILRNPGFDLYVSIEAGVVGTTMATLSIISDSRDRWYGMGPGYMLPGSIIGRLENGEKLSEIAEGLSGISEIKSKSGLVGFLSSNRWTRSELTRISVEIALLSMKWKDIRI